MTGYRTPWRGLGLFLGLILAGLGIAVAVEPEVLVIDFLEDPRSENLPSWVGTHDVNGGEVSKGSWRVAADEAVGMGQLTIDLNPAAELSGLAVTLSFVDIPGTDLSINVHNERGELLAVDLFGNLAESSKAGRTDTFIIPLSKIPGAHRISVRRMQGPLEIRGLVAFPVVESLDDLSIIQKQEVARLLGEKLADPRAQAEQKTQNGRSKSATTESVLQAKDYPDRFWQDSLPGARAFGAYCSGTCYRFFTNLYFSIFEGLQSAERVAFVSSDTALQALIQGRTTMALMSQPPTEAQRADFQQRTGHAMLEVPIALDAVDVLVHAQNRYPAISFETLTSIFAEDGQGERYWDAESGLRGPIMVAGGSPNWGTSQFFSQIVMGGRSFRSTLITLDVAYARGVEEFVSQNLNAIGFAQHRFRTHPVRTLPLISGSGQSVTADAITVNDGTYPLTRNLYLVLSAKDPSMIPEPERRFLDLLLSRTGQRAVADAGSFPLSSSAVRLARERLGLP